MQHGELALGGAEGRLTLLRSATRELVPVLVDLGRVHLDTVGPGAAPTAA